MPRVPNDIYRKVPSVDIYDSWELVTRHMPIEQPPATASYIIFKKGSKIYAKNGTYGHIEYEDTDTSTVIQYAINQLTDTGGLIHIKSGDYTITDTIEIKGRIHIQGDGATDHNKGTHLKLADGANCDMFSFTGTSLEYFFHMSNICLDGNKTNNTSGRGIYCNTNMSDIHINDVFVEYFAENGIQIEGAWGLKLTNSLVEHCDGYGLYLKGDRAKITSCKINDNNNNALIQASTSLIVNSEFCYASQVGLWINDYGIVTSNCIIYGNSDGAVDTYPGLRLGAGSTNCIIRGCYMNGDNKEKYNVEIVSGATDNIISKCIMLNAVTAAINDNGTRTRINGIGKEAAGAGGTPTAANWYIGDIVRNTDDNTLWIKCDDGVMRQIA